MYATSPTVTRVTNPTTNTNTYTYTVSDASLGIIPGGSISFVADLLNPSSSDMNNNTPVDYYSDETIGTSSGDQSSSPVGGTLNFSNFDTYVTAVPEPSTYLSGVAVVLLGAAAAAVRLRR